MPDTGMRSNDMQWDFWTLSPETAHQVAILMSDRGTPRTLRTMNGYGSHTYSWINAGGERFWVKYHFKAVQGVDAVQLRVIAYWANVDSQLGDRVAVGLGKAHASSSDGSTPDG